MRPTFNGSTIGGAIGVICHKLDAVRIKEILEKLDYESGLEFSSKLVPLYHASAEDVSNMLKEFTNSQVVNDQFGDKNKNTPKHQHPNSLHPSIHQARKQQDRS